MFLKPKFIDPPTIPLKILLLLQKAKLRKLVLKTGKSTRAAKVSRKIALSPISDMKTSVNKKLVFWLTNKSMQTRSACINAYLIEQKG